MFGQHGHYAVDQIYGCGAVASLAVEYCVGAYVVCHIGDVYADFVVSVFQAADRERVVEVFCVAWVDCECCDIAHVLACGNYFRRYSRIDFFGGFLHGFGIAVGQSEFGHDSVDLGIVLAFAAEHVDNFTCGVVRVVGPVGYTDHGFVACCSAAQFSGGNEYVGGQKFGIGAQESDFSFDLQCSDEYLVFLFEYFGDDSFGFFTADACGYGHTYAVAVECVHRIAFRDEEFFAVGIGDDAVFAVCAAREDAFRG